MNKYSNAHYDHEADAFAQLPEYSKECGTDYLAVKDAITKISQIKPLNKILDLGCGSGLATRFLKRHLPGTTIVGADINLTMLQEAKLSDPEGIYLHVSKESTFFMPETFDVVVCSFVLHENEDLQALTVFVQEIKRLLRPNGYAILWDVHENLFRGKWQTIEVLQAPKQEGHLYTIKLLPAGANVTGTIWQVATIVELFNQNGFHQVEVDLPIVSKEDGTNWRDETHLAPFFVLDAIRI